MPIGLVNVAVGATASRQWLPGQSLFENLAAAGSEVGRFRAVLWQQGESDVIGKTDPATYVERLVEIRQAAAKRWGFEPPWLLAKSTLHPTVYRDPLQEGQIREAIDRLWRLPGFRPGPKKMLKRPAVKAEYDAQAEEFALLDELLRARRRAGLTQAEVAARMGTKAPAVARLEASGGAKRHSPSIATLRKHAEAVGCRLEIKLKQQSNAAASRRT